MSGSPSTLPTIPTVLQPQIDKVLEYLRQQGVLSMEQQYRQGKTLDNICEEEEEEQEEMNDSLHSLILGGMTTQEHQTISRNGTVSNRAPNQLYSFDREETVQLGELIISQMKKSQDTKRYKANIKEFQEVQKWLSITGFYDPKVRKSILALRDKLNTGTAHMIAEDKAEDKDDDPFNVQSLINQVVATPSSTMVSSRFKKETDANSMNLERRKMIRYI
jgi:hypothetical protein